MQIDVELAISNNVINVEVDKLQTASNGGYERGYEQGYIDGAASMGENPLKYATSLNSTYYDAVFLDGYELRVDVPNIASSLQNGFRSMKGVKKVTISGNINNNPLEMVQTFYYSKTVEIIDFTDFKLNVLRLTNAFSNAIAVREIKGVFDFTNTTNSEIVFSQNTALEELRVKANSVSKNFAIANSPCLSAESIQSIIDGLADLTGQTAQTLTLHATVKAKLTDEQIATITSKNWNLA